MSIKLTKPQKKIRFDKSADSSWRHDDRLYWAKIGLSLFPVYFYYKMRVLTYVWVEMNWMVPRDWSNKFQKVSIQYWTWVLRRKKWRHQEMEHDVPKVEYSYGLMPTYNSYNVIFYSKFYHRRKNEIGRVTSKYPKYIGGFTSQGSHKLECNTLSCKNQCLYWNIHEQVSHSNVYQPKTNSHTVMCSPL